jgi:hypothetical protein
MWVAYAIWSALFKQNLRVGPLLTLRFRLTLVRTATSGNKVRRTRTLPRWAQLRGGERSQARISRGPTCEWDDA